MVAYHVKEQGLLNVPAGSYKYQNWGTQPPPFLAPIYYLSKGVKGQTTYPGDVIHNLLCWQVVTDPSGTVVNQCLNKAYSKLIDRVNETSDIAGEALFKVSEAVHLVESRLLQLYHAARDLKRGNLSGFASTLGFHPKRSSFALKKKNVSAAWLEYHFGWTNLVNDIYRACDVMSSKFPTGIRLKGRGSEVFLDSYDRFEHPGGDGNPIIHHKFFEHNKVMAEQGLRFYLDNYNLHLIQQMGVANPFAVAWALVPFSFVVDWFVDIQSFLLGYTDFVGLNITDTYYTIYVTSSTSESVRYTDDYGTTYDWARFGTAYQTHREPGLVLPTLTPKRITGISPVRAATAASLLVGLLSSFI